MIKKFLEHNDSKVEYTLEDIIDAVQYGFDYSHHCNTFPKVTILPSF